MKSDLIRGIWKQNPVFRLLLGMCPTLAVTNMAINGLIMGVATSFVLIASGIIVSLIKKFISEKVRIPCYIVIIATFVTIADYFIAAYNPEAHKVLGLYVPLIVVNCIILGRIDSFAGKMPIKRAFLDAIGMSIGFTIALLLLATIREFLGFGTIFGLVLLPNYPNMLVMKLPTGAFITLGLLIGLINSFKK